MSRILLGNFQFEQAWSRAGTQLPGRLRTMVQELSYGWWLSCDEGDTIAAADPNDAELAEGLSHVGLPRPRFEPDPARWPAGQTLVPWGWTEDVVRLGRLRQSKFEHPPLDVVCRVNRREFAVSLESDFGCGVEAFELSPGSDWAVRFMQLAEQLGESPSAVLRESLCCSGRGFLRIVPRRLTANDRRWIESRLERGETVLVEPWLTICGQYGVLYDISSAGRIQRLGVLEQLTDGRGGYCGGVWDRRQQYAEVEPGWPVSDGLGFSLRAAEAIARSGYWGPLAIDLVVFRSASGALRCRPVQDVNARMSMGRLLWDACQRLTTGGRWVAWRHWRCPADVSPEAWWRSLVASMPAGVTLYRTGPFSVEGRNVRLMTGLLISDDRAALETVLPSPGLGS